MKKATLGTWASLLILCFATPCSAETTITTQELQSRVRKLLPDSLLEDQLDATISTGPRGGVVTVESGLWAFFKRFSNNKPLEGCVEINDGKLQCAFDVEDNLRWWIFHEALHDVNYSTMKFAWSSRHGGSLDIQIIAEDEGIEIVGSKDADLVNPVLHLFLIPKASSADGTITWDGEIDLDYDGAGVGGQLASWLKGTINDKLHQRLTPKWQSQSNKIGSVIGLLIGTPTTAGNIAIDDSKAVFSTFTPPPTPNPTDRQLTVVFERIDVHDDEDTFGSGELSFEGSLNGNSTGRSNQFDVDSGTSIPLNGGMWSKIVTVAAGGTLAVHFNGFDDDVTTTDSLGTVDESFSAANGFGVGTHVKNSSNADYTLHYRIIDNGAVAPPSTQARHLKVQFNRVHVHDDEDTFGSGELFFWAEINGASTGISPQYDVDSDSWVMLSSSQWSKDVWVPSGSSLSVFFSGYDEDASTRDSLGEVNESFSSANNFGIGSHSTKSSNGDFTIEYTILDPDATPPSGGRELQIVFEKADVHDDEDSFGSGELFFSGEANGMSTGLHGPFSIDSGTTVTLGWTVTVTVPAVGALNVFFTSYDEDSTKNDSLGDVNNSFTAGQNFGIGSHVVQSSNGDYILHYRIVDPSSRRLRVRFQSIDVHNDEDTAGSGELFFEGKANGASTGQSQQFDRDSGQSIVLDGPQWTLDINLAGSDTLKVEFSGFDGDVFGQDSLGNVSESFAQAGNFGIGSHVANSSNSDYTLHFVIEDPDAAPSQGAKRLLVRFDSIDVHDDEDYAGSGELFFSGAANNRSTGLSSQFDVDSGTTLALTDRRWVLEVFVNPSDTLRVSFTGFDQDTFTIDPLGEIEDTFIQQQNWGIGMHVTKANRLADYTLHYTILDPDASPGSVRLRVRFRSILVHNDEDTFGSGELFFRGGAQSSVTALSPQYDVSSGDAITLDGPNWVLDVALQATESLNVSFIGYDEDSTTIDSLGSVSDTFAPSQSWGMGSHSTTSANGDYTIFYDVEAVNAPFQEGAKLYLVLFESIDVRNDEDTFGSGELFFTGTVNGISTGTSQQFDVSSGQTIQLTDLMWQRSVVLRPTDSLIVEFSGFDQDVFGRDSLGSTRNTFTAPPFGEGEHHATSSNGHFVLHYRIVDTTRPAFRVRFKRISVANDEDNSGSGELFFAGAVNGVPTGQSAQFDREGGQEIFLGGSHWTKIIYLDPSNPDSTLKIDFSGFDDDVTTTESLGNIHQTFLGSIGFGTQPSDAIGSLINTLVLKGHDDESSNKDYKLRYVIHRFPAL